MTPAPERPGADGDGPLTGCTVGVTADRRADEQALLLERRGARVVHGPTIRTLSLAEEASLRSATESVIAEPPDVVVLMTGMGTRGWFEAARSLELADGLHEALRRAALYARGPKAAGAVSAAGFDVAWQAPNALASEIVAHIREHEPPGARVVVQLDGSDDRNVTRPLEAAGFEVVTVPIYRWTLPLDPAPAIRLIRGVIDRSVDAVTFTASPAVANFFALADEQGLLPDLLDACNSPDVDVVCVGPVCGARARSLGVAQLVEPERPRLGAMVMAYARAVGDRRG
jgi:uroporphyrinogen-III synthase